jgi:hypothetical protein
MNDVTPPRRAKIKNKTIEPSAEPTFFCGKIGRLRGGYFT